MWRWHHKHVILYNVRRTHTVSASLAPNSAVARNQFVDV